MGLRPGAILGPYEVVGAVGAGGMGEVYRARDTRLGRDVALKILPDEFAHDTERLARFQREAKVLAALSHPHIATIHGVEEAGGTRALVMEFVDGLTLQEYLSRKPAGVELADVLSIAGQIALALEAAHERGIIHRDLKPANIKLREDGTIKVLDFGLAKPVDALARGDIAASPTVTAAPMTAHGVLLGTAAYMSPEQARGRAVDKRADIWAFGVVVFELLTGRSLFVGTSSTDVIAQVITAEPDWNALPARVPPSLTALLQRCLSKDPNARLRDIGEARIALERIAHHAGDEPSTVRVPARSPWHRAWPLVLAASAGVAIGFFGGTARTPAPAGAPAVTMRATIPVNQPQTLAIPRTMTFALTRDGRWLIFKGTVKATNQLFLRDMMMGGEARPISGSEGVGDFTTSPDGAWLLFSISAKGSVKKVPLAGGTPLQVCGCSADAGMFWAADGFVYFPTWRDKKWVLRKMPEAGGAPVDLPVSPEYESKQLTHPAPLPGGRRLLVVVSDPGAAIVSPSIAAYDLDSHAVTPLVKSGTSPRYLPTGHIMFASGTVLYAVAFDASTLKVTGAPAPLVEHVTASPRFAHAGYALGDAAGHLCD